MSESEEDFASMFEASLQATHVAKGQTVEGTIVAIGPKVAFVSVGGKGEALIEIAELKNDEGVLEYAVGARIQAVVVSTEGGLTLSTKLTRAAATARQLEDAYRAGLPVEGKVEAVVKGGYDVRMARQRAFCPMSQIDTMRTANPAEHEGRVYAFRIIEYKEGGRNIVVSRRALLEEEQRASAAHVRRSIVVGAVLTGRVTSVRDFGAFVDLGGGVQGLLHVSEMGWSRVADTSQVVKAGDEITVKVLRVDEDGQKIALGLKQLTADPWSTLAATYAVGQMCTGRVTRLTEFGAFVELEPGVEALAHVSTFAPTGRSEAWSRSLTVGMSATFEILSLDPDKKRIGVAFVHSGTDGGAHGAIHDAVHAAAAPAGAKTVRPAGIAPGARLTGKVERHETFGVFVFLAPGRTGLIPTSETGLTREADVVKAYPVGAEIEVMVLEVDPSGRRIRLSRKAVLDAEGAEELRDYAQRQAVASTEAFGSLADRFRGALEPR